MKNDSLIKYISIHSFCSLIGYILIGIRSFDFESAQFHVELSKHMGWLLRVVYVLMQFEYEYPKFQLL
jgi:hypothetical protein